MKMREAILSVMKAKKISQTALAKMFGYPHQSTIAGRLNVKNMSENSSIEMLDMLGYELVIRPKCDEGETYVITLD